MVSVMETLGGKPEQQAWTTALGSLWQFCSTFPEQSARLCQLPDGG